MFTQKSAKRTDNSIFVVLVTYAAVYIALGQETAQNIGLSELYIKVMSALFVAVIAVFAFIPRRNTNVETARKNKIFIQLHFGRYAGMKLFLFRDIAECIDFYAP